MTSKATNQRDLTDVIKKQKRDGKKAAGITRAQASGISGADTAITSGQKTSAGGAGGSPVTQDLQMNTFDIRDVDRLYFSTTAGSADALTANDTGIESASYYDGTNYYSVGMNYRIPSPAPGMGHYFIIGSEQCLTVKNDKIEVKKPLRLTTGTATGSYLSGSMYYDGTDIQAVVPAGTVNLTSGGGGGGWVGTATSDLNMANYDINTLDRLLFSTTGTDNIGSSDMGIGTNSNDGDYLTYNVPTGYQRFKVGGTLAMSVGPTLNPGLTVENQLYVNGALTSTGNTAFNGNVDIGNSSGDSLTISSTLDAQLKMGNNKITSLATPTTDYDAATKKYVDDNSGGGGGISNPVNAQLSMASTGSTAQSITRIDTIYFDGDGANSAYINGHTNGLDYDVDDTDEYHSFAINGTVKFRIGDSVVTSYKDIQMSSNDVLGAQSIRFNTVSWSGTGGAIWYDGTNLKGKASTGNAFTIEASGGGGSGAGLGDNNTWTGTNSFNGSYVGVGGTFSATGVSSSLGNSYTDYVNLEGVISIGQSTSKIGFFGTTPIVKGTLSVFPSASAIRTLLASYGLC